MATWALTAQLTTGTLAVNSTDQIWWMGSAFGTNVVVSAFQDSTHITLSDGTTHRCTTAHVHNTKWIDGTHVSIDGAASSLLPIATGSCGLLFVFSDASSIATSATTFYATDAGGVDANQMAGVTFWAAEGGVSTSWVDANPAARSGSWGLSLQNQVAATSHNFYVATSVSPTSTGAKSGKVKIALTYV
jgi:hypothetical protein